MGATNFGSATLEVRAAEAVVRAGQAEAGSVTRRSEIERNTLNLTGVVCGESSASEPR